MKIDITNNVLDEVVVLAAVDLDVQQVEQKLAFVDIWHEPCCDD